MVEILRKRTTHNPLRRPPDTQNLRIFLSFLPMLLSQSPFGVVGTTVPSSAHTSGSAGAVCSVQYDVGRLFGLNQSRCRVGHHCVASWPVSGSMISATIPS